MSLYLLSGGAGFIGTNFAINFLKNDKHKSDTLTIVLTILPYFLSILFMVILISVNRSSSPSIKSSRSILAPSLFATSGF